MKKIFKEYLFQKHMFVCENAEAGLAVNEEPHVFETLYPWQTCLALASLRARSLRKRG